MTDHFDLIVIGSGPAGEKGAAAAAWFGKRVALIEKENVLGGAAANTGTLPSKTLRETALFLSGFRQRQFRGLDVGLKSAVGISDFLAHERVVKDTERLRIRENLTRHRVSLFKGTASFVDAHTVAVLPDRCPEVRLTADFVLIATGSYPFRPAAFPFHDPRVHDSDTILTLDEIPKRLGVIGGGVIGSEYACVFAALGVEVSVIEKRATILAGMDAEVVHVLRKSMESSGVRFFLEDSVEQVRDNGTVELRLASGESVHVDAVLVSSGRCGHTKSLGLDRIDVEANSRGQVLVNAHMQTNVPNVYAAGDVVGNPALASTAMEQGRIAVAHAFGMADKSKLAPVLPLGVYTIPECSMAGATEEELRAAGTPYIAGKATYAANARGQIIGDRTGFLKLLFHAETMKLLGVHVIGEGATELVHVGLTALLVEAGADLFLAACYNYPTLTEMYKYSTYDALGRKAALERERAQATETLGP